MSDAVKIYKGNKKYAIFCGVFFFILLSAVTFPLVIGTEPINTNKVIGLGIFWVMASLLSVAPLAFSMEVGTDYIKTYFFNFCRLKIASADVRQLDYGYHPNFGMGITVQAIRNGKIKRYDLSESILGKEAIAHARRVLEPK